MSAGKAYSFNNFIVYYFQTEYISPGALYETMNTGMLIVIY